MAKLHGWNPKRRTHSIPGPTHSDAELSTPLEELEFDPSYIEPVVTLTTRGKLVEQFYRKNNFQDDCNAWIKMILDPPEYCAPKQHFWVVVHYGDFYTLIDHSYRGAMEVHRARLFYRQERGRRLWLASAQLGPLYFYSQDAVATAYITTLVRKEFYISPKSSKQIVAV